MQGPTESSLFDFTVTPEMGSTLKETAKWCRFITIVSFILLVFLLAGGLVAGGTMAPILSRMFPGSEGFLAGALIAVILLCVLIGGVFIFLLYRFSTYTKKGIELHNQEIFNKGLKSLRLYFLIYGVFAILSLLGNITTLFRY